MNPRLFFFLSLSRSLYPCLLCNDTRNGQWSHEMFAWFDVYIFRIFRYRGIKLAEIFGRIPLGWWRVYVFSSCIFIKEGWFWYGVNDCVGSFELFYMQFKLIETLLKFKFIVFSKFEFQTSSRKFLSPKRKINPLYTSFHYSFTLFAHSRGRIHRGWSKCKTI